MKYKINIFLLIISFAFLFSCGTYEKSSKDSADKIENLDTADDFAKEDNSDKAGNGILVTMLIFAAILGPITVFFFWYFIPLGLWYEAWLSGMRVSWWKLIKMRFQKIPQELMLKTMIEAKNAGLKIETTDLMEKYLADVDISVVTDTAIRAVNAGIDINFNDLASKYLAKVNVETIMHALITAKNADLVVTINQLAAHYLANVDVIKVVTALISAHNAGYDEFTLETLKEHYLANGDVTKTVDAFIAAKKAIQDEIHFEDIAAIDLAGIDVMSAVSSAINPRVIETNAVSGIARDGVQLIMKLKLTVRANLKKIIGGAGEDTVLARVDESLSSEIGLSKSHFDVLQNPFELAERVEKKDLGRGTAFFVLSVDVSEIKVGKDVHAELQIERAKANAEVAKADLIRAEEKVKKAMAAAFMNGKLTVSDYHEMMNTEADTYMRNNIIEEKKGSEETENEEFKNH